MTALLTTASTAPVPAAAMPAPATKTVHEGATLSIARPAAISAAEAGRTIPRPIRSDIRPPRTAPAANMRAKTR